MRRNRGFAIATVSVALLGAGAALGQDDVDAERRRAVDLPGPDRAGLVPRDLPRHGHVPRAGHPAVARAQLTARVVAEAEPVAGHGDRLVRLASRAGICRGGVGGIAGAVAGGLSGFAGVRRRDN